MATLTLAVCFFLQLYHACDAELSVVCVLRPNVLQYSDFLTAVVSFWVTLLCLAELSTPVRTLVSTFGVLCIAIGVENDRTGILVIALPIGLGLTFVFFTWVSLIPFSKRFWGLCQKLHGASFSRVFSWYFSLCMVKSVSDEPLFREFSDVPLQ